MAIKVCTKCGIKRDSGEFYGNQSWCKPCYKAWHRARYQPKHGTDDAPRDCAWCGASYQPKTRRVSLYCSSECKAAERRETGAQRAQHLLRKYGITPDDYDRMLAEQGGGCAICGAAPTEQKAKYRTFLHVDHCHDTGAVRGLLCGEHNLLIGRFNDDPALLRKAADYIERKR